MAEADALALDNVLAHGRAVQQQVYDVVVQQVDLVDVQQPAVGRGQHARLEVALAALDRLLDVQRADDPVLGGADRQVDKAGAAGGHRQQLAGLDARAALVAVGGRHVGIAAKVTVGHGADFRQQEGQGAGGRAFGRAALAADQHAADLRMDGIEDQRALHALLADDSGKRKDTWHSFLLSLESSSGRSLRSTQAGADRSRQFLCDYT